MVVKKNKQEDEDIEVFKGDMFSNDFVLELDDKNNKNPILSFTKYVKDVVENKIIQKRKETRIKIMYLFYIEYYRTEKIYRDLPVEEIKTLYDKFYGENISQSDLWKELKILGMLKILKEGDTDVYTITPNLIIDVENDLLKRGIVMEKEKENNEVDNMKKLSSNLTGNTKFRAKLFKG